MAKNLLFHIIPSSISKETLSAFNDPAFLPLSSTFRPFH